MNLQDFSTALEQNPEKQIAFVLPNGDEIPRHFHITEIGKVVKDFVDCGGTRRTTESCMLQTWVASDTEHRITTTKLGVIVGKANVLGLSAEAPVEAEVQVDTIGIFAVDQVTADNERLTFSLIAKQTACLAPEKCRLDVLPVMGDSQGCCGDETDCC